MDLNKQLKRELERVLVENDLISYRKEVIEEEVDVSAEEADESNKGIASDGTAYNKKRVMQYLQEKGCPFTQDYVDMAAKKFPFNSGNITDGGKITIQKSVIRSGIDTFSDNLDEYMKIKNMEAIFDLKKCIIKSQIMEYAVETVHDNRSGGTDVKTLERVINNYSRKGWTLKQTFTNELGVNSTSVSTSVGTFGTNSTIDQVVLIFERSKAVYDYLEKNGKIKK